MPTRISPLPGPRAAAQRTRRRPPSDPAHELTARVLAARAGDQQAWSALVEQFDRRLRRIARSYRMAPADVDDVVQTTWLRSLERIGQLREPNAIASWLERITRRECLRLLQRRVSEWPTDEASLGDRADEQGPEERLLAAEERLLAIERREVLDGALQQLPQRHRHLMTLLTVEPAPSYRQISALLDIPIGSIGPIRARSLDRMRRHYELRAY
jgi:RNA polymerase sigma factor (sigma-70 family)